MSALECAEYNAEIDKQSENEHDLAIWWEAYRAALSRAHSTPYEAGEDADEALSAYKAKAAELARKK